MSEIKSKKGWAYLKEKFSNLRKKINKENSLNSLLVLLFVLFLGVTVVYIFYTLFVPTPTEWGIVTRELQKNSTGNYVAMPNATSFPNNFNLTNLGKAEFRHLAVISEYITGSFLINTINFAFLTMFIRNIGKDVEEGIKGSKEKVPMSVYVGWTMGALISGILFFSSSIANKPIDIAIVYLGVIVVFAVVSNYVLYELRKKLIVEEKNEEKVNPSFRKKPE